jgi:hypothetical protein
VKKRRHQEIGTKSKRGKNKMRGRKEREAESNLPSFVHRKARESRKLCTGDEKTGDFVSASLQETEKKGKETRVSSGDLKKIR